jgi:hypothetical protein
MKLVHAAVIAVVVAGTASLMAQAGPRRDGNWDITLEMQMPGMPNMPNMPAGMAGMAMPPVKLTQCITKEQAADPAKALPSRPAGRGGAAPDCQVSDYKVVGNKVSWAMVCAGAQPMTGTGEFTYGTDSYTGLMTMNMDRGGSAMAMTMKYTGKRLGDCVK